MQHLHFIGIGGIGMSGLASWCRSKSYQVSGSDRDALKKENQHIFTPLKAQGIGIFPQDGSFIADGAPDAVIYSSAIESDNPDLKSAEGLHRLHRSELLAMLLNDLKDKKTIAVAGSCGKSTVTAYLAEALTNCGHDTAYLNGAISKRFITPECIGNFKDGSGPYMVFEADESDKSLLNYTPDYAVILNMGTDHYSKEELSEVFGKFLNRTRSGAVVAREVFEAVRPHLDNPGLKIRIFDQEGENVDYFISDFRMEKHVDAIYAGGKRGLLNAAGNRLATEEKGANNLLEICGIRQEECRIESIVPVAEFNRKYKLELPAPGFHTAVNALAIFAMLEMLGTDTETALHGLTRFDGIRRRNDLVGITSSGALIYDDYAHNPEKINSCLSTLKQISSGRIFAVFQPHGFGPLGFFRNELLNVLEKSLRPGDEFIMLPPFYAGGTSSFKPTSEEVIADWQSHSAKPEYYSFCSDRTALREQLLADTAPGDLIVIMGARDNSLSDYASSFKA